MTQSVYIGTKYENSLQFDNYQYS